MDEPTPGGVATQPQPMRRFDWERLIMRAHLPRHLKTTALAMAVFADFDGSNVRPGNELLADALDTSKTWVGDCVNALVDLGLLILERKGGGKKRPGQDEDVLLASIYQLSTPGEVLTLRLDPDWKRYIPRAKGRTPTNRPSGRSTYTNPASTRSPVENRTEPNPASSQMPVENAIDANTAWTQTTAGDPIEANPASPRCGYRDQAQRAPRSSGAATEINPAWDYQGDQPQTRTTRVVALGGERHLTLIHSRATEEEFDHPVVVDPEPPEPAAPTVRPVPDVSDEQYAAAHDRLSTLPDYGTALLAQAIAEFGADGWSDVPATVLAVRAAEIADRHTPRSA